MHTVFNIYYRYIIYNPFDNMASMTDFYYIKRATSVRTGSDNVFPILCYKKRIEHRIVFKTNSHWLSLSFSDWLIWSSYSLIHISSD